MVQLELFTVASRFNTQQIWKFRWAVRFDTCSLSLCWRWERKFPNLWCEISGVVRSSETPVFSGKKITCNRLFLTRGTNLKGGGYQAPGHQFVGGYYRASRFPKVLEGGLISPTVAWNYNRRQAAPGLITQAITSWISYQLFAAVGFGYSGC